MHRLRLFATVLLITGTLIAQRNNDPHYGGCGAANGGGANSTNYYGGGADPCAYTYSVPSERLNQLLNDVSYCTMYSRTQVNCSRELKGNYDQVRLDRRDGAGMGGGKNPGSLPEASYPTVPLSAITPAQRADAERMFQRSLTTHGAKSVSRRDTVASAGRAFRSCEGASHSGHRLSGRQRRSARRCGCRALVRSGRGARPSCCPIRTCRDV